MPPRRIKKDPKVRLRQESAARRAAYTPHRGQHPNKHDRSARRRCERPHTSRRRPRAAPRNAHRRPTGPSTKTASRSTRAPSAGLLLKGLLKPLPKKGEVPDCLLVEPFTEEVVPANAAAVLAHLPSAGADAAYCYAKPPGDADVYKLHAADNRAPEALPTL